MIWSGAVTDMKTIAITMLALPHLKHHLPNLF
jgi:hypothetical protein